MSDAMERLTARLGRSTPTAGPALFVCRHRVFGVGMFDVAAVLEGDRLVAEAGERRRGEVDVVVGPSPAATAPSVCFISATAARGPAGHRAVPVNAREPRCVLYLGNEIDRVGPPEGGRGRTGTNPLGGASYEP